MSSEFVQFSHITKRFAGVIALSDVSLSIIRGECHGLMGENGAGKSTLGKILAGIHRPDEGEILIDGARQEISSPADALRAGVGMVHQELAFCPDLSVAENLCMGQYPRRMRMFINRAEMNRRARALLRQIGVWIDVTQPMRALSTAQEQLVQIASAVGTDAKILVFDEPTSSLSEPEAQELFKLIQSLKERGVTMIYVSHRMPELFHLCDRISVLRDGKFVGTVDRDKADQDTIVRMMIGRSVGDYFPQHLSSKPGETILRVSGLSSPGNFQDISFEVHAGEIVGFAGLVGAGRSEVAKAIFGLDHSARGEVHINGEKLSLGSVQEAMNRGVGFLPEDRKRQGLVLMMSGRANVSLAMLDRLSRLGILGRSAERKIARDFFQKLNVKAPSIEMPVAGMSGGNQQKVAISKWLARGAKLLIVDEPTRGVDVGAKAAIHQLIDDLARQGVGIMLISSELPEVLNLSTRIIVMRGGRIVGQVPRADATQETVLRLMAGVKQSQTV
ncbi:MAG TPA: sugar ABC transporter ATP-binding protein [Tepidisphaeraceae bacterium]